MKSLQEILDKLSEEHNQVMETFDFMYSDLLQFLPYDKAKEHLKPDVTKEEWEKYYKPLNRGNVIGCMEAYMKFAWEKCLGERGLSSVRSLAHYQAWLWILDDDKTLEYLLDDKNYACFGAPVLQYICNKYKWDFEDMIEDWQLETAIQFIVGKGC